MAEMPNALTPENIAVVAQHADKILAAVFGQNQSQPAVQNTRRSDCCCPRKIKFFIFGNTWINNYNTACPFVADAQ